MKILNSLSTSGPGGADNLNFTSFPAGKQCIGLRMRLTVPLTVAGGGGTISNANLQAILAHFVPLRLVYGKNQDRVIWPSIDLSEIRTLVRFITQVDIQTNIPVGTAVNAGAKSAIFDVFYPFTADYYRGHQKLPGTSQMQSFRLEVNEANTTAIDALTVRAAGAATWDIVPVYIDGPDQWAPCLSLFKVNSPRLEAITPTGLILAAWDVNAIAASTAITRYSNIVGGETIDDTIYPQLAIDEATRQNAPGATDVNDTVTILFMQPRRMPLEAMRPGELLLKLVNQDVATLQLRGAYYPVISEEEGQEAAIVAAQRRNIPVLASMTSSPAGAHRGHPSVAVIGLHANNEAAFLTRAGHVGFANGQSATSIPEAVTAQSNAVVSGHGGVSSPTGAKVAAAHAHAIASQVPGAVNHRGQHQGAAKATIHASLGTPQ